MSDDMDPFTDLPDDEEELARRLARVGQVMQEQEQYEAEIDPVFARNLRAHLVLGEEGAPHPGFARALRQRLLQEGMTRPVPRARRQRWLLRVGAAASALLALLAVLLIAVLGSQHRNVPSFAAPYPTVADLTYSFPAPPAVIHTLSPITSLVHPRAGVPYVGRLQLTAVGLPHALRKLTAYRLMPPPNVLATGRHLLGIRSAVRLVTVGSALWDVAADGGGRLPLHSLAVDRASGELIYHDRRNLLLPRAQRALSRDTAVSVARRWLIRLGWPGQRMPLVAVETAPHKPKVREVELGWSGVGEVATDAATLWVTPSKSVIEAWLWPPVAQQGSVPARSILSAWTSVEKGALPLAVEGVSPTMRARGVGTVRSTAVVSILSMGRKGSVYLVPAYRFEGKAHIFGASVHTWYSLAPGARR